MDKKLERNENEMRGTRRIHIRGGYSTIWATILPKVSAFYRDLSCS